MQASSTQLHRLAGLYNVSTVYQDMEGRQKQASDESLIVVLQSLQAPIQNIDDVSSALHYKEQQIWQQIIEPVIVLWENEPLCINLRLPQKQYSPPIRALLTLENGEYFELCWKNEEILITTSISIEGTNYLSLRIFSQLKLPLGYHKISFIFPGQTAESLVICSPLKAFSPPSVNPKIWGAFVPLYALHSGKSWGAGDFSDLESLIKWLSGVGAGMVGTLPLLPSFFDSNFGPGPYMPASKLFWNEFYLDIERIPELERCPEAAELMNSPEFKKQIVTLQSSQRVDYIQQLNLKRKVLESLSECFFNDKPERYFDFVLYSESHPSLDDYANFRSAGETHGVNWENWPEQMRNGIFQNGDYPEKVKQYYQYTQWLAQEQIDTISQNAKDNNLFLYMDLPVGVHPYSYDVWKEKTSFVSGINGGAPPDPVFTSGQNWSFPPLHPENIRKEGYHYVIKNLRHQLRQCGMLRIDHIMNFHRLFWIPEGMNNADGVYVGYKAEEFYAILTLESSRSKTIIIGEDLGMVPPEVRPMMEKHGIRRMFVGQYEMITENHINNIPSQAIVSLNTHDMFPFASFWNESDILERQKLKLLDSDKAKKELEERRQIKRTLLSMLQYKGLLDEFSQDPEAILKAIVVLLASSQAFAYLINLEDLWLEIHPQNIPGTNKSSNWSRKTRYNFEHFSKSSEVTTMLHKIDKARKGNLNQ
jgi:4-alpha-glucanotransferase